MDSRDRRPALPEKSAQLYLPAWTRFANRTSPIQTAMRKHKASEGHAYEAGNAKAGYCPDDIGYE